MSSFPTRDSLLTVGRVLDSIYAKYCPGDLGNLARFEEGGGSEGGWSLLAREGSTYCSSDMHHKLLFLSTCSSFTLSCSCRWRSGNAYLVARLPVGATNAVVRELPHTTPCGRRVRAGTTTPAAETTHHQLKNTNHLHEMLADSRHSGQTHRSSCVFRGPRLLA